MGFTSLNFFIFLAIVLVVYFVVPKKTQWMVLLAGSYAFYLLSSPKTFIFLLVTTISVFFGGKLIDRQNREHKDFISQHKDSLDKAEKKELKLKNQKKKRKTLALFLLLNFGILAFLKYFRYYIDLFIMWTGLSAFQFDVGVLIPLGISFYTFQATGYLIDIYRGKYTADQNIAKFALFVSFFPQIIQGPISRYDQLAKQLYESHKFEYTRIKFGAQLMLWGVFKKLVIADRLNIFVKEVFDNYTQYHGLIVIMAVTFYTIQIYADFSGGMDIARGASQIMGIDLIENFKRPYFSLNIPEFWRRWHITLGAWCRDYIFYPLSLSKPFGKLGKKSRSVLGERLGKLFPVIIAQVITFLTIGIWHGAELKYIVYGFYHGGFIILGIIFEPYINELTKKLKINTKAFSWKMFQIIRTFVLVVIGRFFSRGVSVSAALYMMKASLEFNSKGLTNGVLFELGLQPKDFLLLFACFFVWFCVSLMQENGIGVRMWIAEQNLLFRWMIYLIGVFSVIIFGIYGIGYDATMFIYRGF